MLELGGRAFLACLITPLSFFSRSAMCGGVRCRAIYGVRGYSFRLFFSWLIVGRHSPALLGRSWVFADESCWSDVDRYFQAGLWIGDALWLMMVPMLTTDFSRFKACSVW